MQQDRHDFLAQWAIENEVEFEQMNKPWEIWDWKLPHTASGTLNLGLEFDTGSSEQIYF